MRSPACQCAGLCINVNESMCHRKKGCSLAVMRPFLQQTLSACSSPYLCVSVTSVLKIPTLHFRDAGDQPALPEFG